jgi:hypothetical protein
MSQAGIIPGFSCYPTYYSGKQKRGIVVSQFTIPPKKGEYAWKTHSTIYYTTSIKLVNGLKLVNKKGSIGITNTPLVNVGEEGLSPHKLKNEKVINYSL